MNDVDGIDNYNEELSQFPDENALDIADVANNIRNKKRDSELRNEEYDQLRRDQLRNDLSDPSIMQSGEIREENTANFLQQINPDNELENLEHRLRGDRKDNFTKQWIPNEACKINELLIQNYVSFLGAIINQNTSLSNLSKAQINKLMSLCIAWVTDDMLINCKTYGLKGKPSEMTRIGIIILTLTFMTLNQALNGNRGRVVLNRVSLTGNLDSPNSKAKGDSPLKFWS